MALFSLIGNRITLKSSRFSISILVWRVHPLALHLIAPCTWPRNHWREVRALHCPLPLFHSFILCSGPWFAGTSCWILGNVPAEGFFFLSVINEISNVLEDSGLCVGTLQVTWLWAMVYHFKEPQITLFDQTLIIWLMDLSFFFFFSNLGQAGEFKWVVRKPKKTKNKKKHFFFLCF